MQHGGEQLHFHFKVISQHRTALNRQREAARTRRRGKILNSKAEFNRCHIPRLVVEVEDEDTRKKRLDQEKKDKEEIEQILDNMNLRWEERKTMEKELMGKKKTIRVGGW